LKKANLKDIAGGDARENAQIILSVLSGGKGPRRDIVLLNAAYALVASGKAKEVKDAIKMASESIDSGKAMEKLKQLKEFRA
jgi:anthranilate phosphoribosyltransferase